MQTSNDQSRRDFIKTSAAIGAGLILWSPLDILATDKGDKMNAITTKGYAAFDESGVIKPWTFTRRPVGNNVTKFKVGDRAGVGCIVDGYKICGK